MATNIVPARDLTWCVIDTETTGLDPDQGARIIEVAMVRVEAGEVTDVFTSLVDAGVSVPDEVSAINRITDADLVGAPTFAELADAVEARMRGCLLVAHNMSFDWKFMAAEFGRIDREPPPAKKACTLEGARELLTDLPRHRLGMCCEHLGITLEGWHAALADTMACATLAQRLTDLAEAKGRGTLPVDPWYSQVVPTAELPTVAHKPRAAEA